VVDAGLGGSERAGDVRGRGQAALDGLAGGPVLTVGQVPEVHGVRRAEALLLDDVLREGPRAGDPRPLRRQRHQQVRHHVVRMQRDQQVRQDRGIHHVRQLVLVEPRHRDTPAAAVERHRLHAGAQVHPATDPVARALLDVVTAVRQRDPAELRMDHRAVVALLVVLDDDLPVRLHVVLVRLGGHQRLRVVRRDDRLELADVLTELPGGAGPVDEDPAVPLMHPDRREGERGPVVVLVDVPEVRRPDQASVVPVGPRVVRADDRTRRLGRPATREQLVTAVPAHVLEGAQHAVLVTDEEYAVATDRLGAQAGGRHVGGATDAHPVVEQITAFPLQDLRRHVRVARQQPALAERRQRQRQLGRVERCRWGRHLASSGDVEPGRTQATSN
jgi:hypothetical protein